ncbi:MAG: DUF3021 domain-containing protein [Clostridia bacterium]|nr:DUF3021 domain-containing protein [Clostridia bacterium]
MNTYVRAFLHRGLIFGGFGPIVAGIVFCILEFTLADFSLEGDAVLLAIVSTYFLAFVQAGASVFNQIEHWPVAKSVGLHFLLLYAAYSLCYVVNRWIPFHPMVLLIFTVIFVLTYLIIWLTVYVCVRHAGHSLNRTLQKNK